MGNGQSVAAFNYAKRLLHFALINKTGKQKEIRAADTILHVLS